MKTFSARPGEVPHNWLLVDAEGQTLGHMASAIATRLRGKHKAEFTPHVDTGDFVVVINADKIQVTGRKTTDKMYHSHSGFPGGLKSISFAQLLERSAGAGGPAGGTRHDAAQSPGPGHAEEIESLRRCGASPLGAATGYNRAVTGTHSNCRHKFKL